MVKPPHPDSDGSNYRSPVLTRLSNTSNPRRPTLGKDLDRNLDHRLYMVYGVIGVLPFLSTVKVGGRRYVPSQLVYFCTGEGRRVLWFGFSFDTSGLFLKSNIQV